MDFRKEKQIGKDIEAEFEQLKFTGGFDHNYVTDGYTPVSYTHLDVYKRQYKKKLQIYQKIQNHIF